MVHGKSNNSSWEWIEEVISQRQAALIRYVASFLGETERAKDVVQDVFIKLCRQKREDIEPHLAPWLFRVARNRAMDVLRKEGRMRLLGESDEVDRLAGGAQESVEEMRKKEAIGSILDLVASLPQRQKELVELKFRQGLTYKEIAEATGMTVGNVGYVMHHAIKDLKEMWQQTQNV